LSICGRLRYAFEATVAKGSDFATCIENIDIGGPSMLRSSAKNHAYVAIATAPAQYPELMAQMRANSGCTSLGLRRRFAAQAFATSAAYDSAIAAWWQTQALAATASEEQATAAEEQAPLVVTRAYVHDRKLKYGCNPHQVEKLQS
jgi:phosphoribosylaminoimidazolecarboxamide formyltransferase/IMP cyclohydrolase